jgi:hypothetical protein
MDDTRNDIREEANRVDNQATQYRKLATELAEVATTFENEVRPDAAKHEVDVNSYNRSTRKTAVIQAWYDDFRDVPMDLIAADGWCDAGVEMSAERYRLRLAAECDGE